MSVCIKSYNSAANSTPVGPPPVIRLEKGNSYLHIVYLPTMQKFKTFLRSISDAVGWDACSKPVNHQPMYRTKKGESHIPTLDYVSFVHL